MSKTEVFISYSRKNSERALQVVESLEKRGFDVWFDKQDIPFGEDWRREIYQGIERSDAFIFLISPPSISSEVCNEEIAYAVKQGKRILPVVLVDADMETFHNPDMRKLISSRNWVYCRSEADLESAMDGLTKAVKSDYEWVRFHTELQRKANAWRGSWLDFGRLVLGDELKNAEARLKAAEARQKAGRPKDPSLTSPQVNLITASRKFTNFLRRLVIAVSTAVVITVAVLYIRPYVQMERAIPGNWVSIPAGPFTMGMNDEEANLTIELCNATAGSEDDKKFCPQETEEDTDKQKLLNTDGRLKDANLPEFMILENEVTNAQYKQCMDAEACTPHKGWAFESVDINKPAADLLWSEASAYCEWLGGQLPTEGEWEKAARGRLNTIFPWGDEWMPKYANQVNGGVPQRIDAFAATDVNDYPVYNMAGNVMEWTSSAYVDHAEGAEFSNSSLNPSEVEDLIWVTTRGGSWRTVASDGMASHRGYYLSTEHNPNIGFRCVCPEGQECNSPWSLWWIWSHSYYPDK